MGRSGADVGQHLQHVLGRDKQQQEDQKSIEKKVPEKMCLPNRLYPRPTISKTSFCEAVHRSSTTPDDAFDPVEDILIGLNKKQQEVSKASVASIHT